MTRPCPPFRAFLPGASAILSPKGAGHIRTVIYLDVLLLVNFTTTSLFLLAAGLLSGVTASGWRVTAGAALGAAASLILLAPTAPWPLGLAYQTATGAVIVLAAYGWPGARCFLRLAAWFTALHLALTGAVLLPGAHSNNFSVYLPLSPGLLLLCAGGVYLAVQGVLRLLGRRGGQTVPATLLVAGAALPLNTAMLAGMGTIRACAAGFSVQEPLSGRAVVLVRYAAAQSALPPPLGAYLSAYFSGGTAPPPPELALRFVPCTTVAGHCILPAVPAALASAPARPLYAAFCDLPPPPGGWEMLAGEEVMCSI